ncbi:MAG: putative aminopeptidase YsdC [Firmicutes bacterium ADurb.Bin300]|nr:MAG: putative aminopeptidase YsdC [Firmicutes bacterium ADurb.Bin300]
MLNLLRELCSIYGTSGNENGVAQYIVEKIKNIEGVTYHIDALGNVIVFKKGKNSPQRTVMLDAHMDEVGLIVLDADEKGFVKFATVGSIDEKVLLGRRVVVGEKLINGVIGLKPIHLLDEEAKKKLPSVNEMYIDIGAKDKAQAQEYVSPGDCAYFFSEFTVFGENKVKCRAIDDRFGCAAMLQLIQLPLEYDTWFSFSVQEEVGLRGAGVSSFSVNPDYAVIIEATTAADIIGVEGGDRVCVQGEGPAISFGDRTTLYNKELYKKAMETARAKGVKCQLKTRIAGGNNAGAIHKSRSGVKVLTVSLPCRYIHSAASVADLRDAEETVRFIRAVLPMLWND